MSLRESYAQALFIVQNLDPAQLQQLQGICQEVRIAQNSLRSAASDLLIRCRDNCEGLCCRNIEIDTIINHWDFVFILASGGTSPDRMVKCLEKENPLFRSDCIFLQDGRGPCIFPADTRPEVCLTTFCDDTAPIAKEIRKLKWAFLKINRFVLRNRPILLLRSIFSLKKGLL